MAIIKRDSLADHAALAKMREALFASAALKRDECGDWNLFGKSGHIYAIAPMSFYLYCAPGSVRAWNFAKRAMSFAKVTQDGGEEGFLHMDRLPTPDEAAVIRDRLGIRKRRELSEGTLQALRERVHKWHDQAQGRSFEALDRE